MTTYVIETLVDGQWDSMAVGDQGDGYETLEAADAALDSLLETCTTPDWQDAEYRVTEVQS